MAYSDKKVTSIFLFTGTPLLELTTAWDAFLIELPDWDNYKHTFLAGENIAEEVIIQFLTATFAIGTVDGATSVSFYISSPAENIEALRLSPVYTFSLADATSVAQAIGTTLAAVDLTGQKSIKACFKTNAGTATVDQFGLTYSPKR